MRGQALILFVVVTMALVGVIVYLLPRQNAAFSPDRQVIEYRIDTRIATEDDALTQIIDSGESYLCAIDAAGVDTDLKVKGTNYYYDDKFRSDIRMTTSGASTDLHTIIDGEYVYVWNEGLTGKGARTKYFPEDARAIQGYDKHADPLLVTGRCVPYPVTLSRFKPPFFINFETVEVP